MEPVGAAPFEASGERYDAFMGRYSERLAPLLLAGSGLIRGQSAIDVGCGPGSLTSVLAARLDPTAVAAVDPSASFVKACVERLPGVEVRLGRAEALPFPDRAFDAAFAQLVLHFTSDPELAASEMRRVVRPGGTVSACVWDFAGGMQMLRAFWDAALAVDRDAPDEATTMRFGRPGEIADLFGGAGLIEIAETVLEVECTYGDFDELWSGFMQGIGPAGTYCVALPPQRREALRGELFDQLGAPSGPFSLTAKARSVRGEVPDHGANGEDQRKTSTSG